MDFFFLSTFRDYFKSSKLFESVIKKIFSFDLLNKLKRNVKFNEILLKIYLVKKCLKLLKKFCSFFYFRSLNIVDVDNSRILKAAAWNHRVKLNNNFLILKFKIFWNISKNFSKLEFTSSMYRLDNFYKTM